jgi:hypothetical protein
MGLGTQKKLEISTFLCEVNYHFTKTGRTRAKSRSSGLELANSRRFLVLGLDFGFEGA